MGIKKFSNLPKTLIMFSLQSFAVMQLVGIVWGEVGLGRWLIQMLQFFRTENRIEMTQMVNLMKLIQNLCQEESEPYFHLSLCLLPPLQVCMHDSFLAEEGLGLYEQKCGRPRWMRIGKKSQ